LPLKKKRVKFTLAPVAFRDSAIEGRGVFALRRFEPGDNIVPYAPKQRRVDVWSFESRLAAQTKLTLLSDDGTVIIPDTSEPGGWLCNHSCRPNAAIYSSREGRIQCMRTILPGEEVTIFYGWVSENEPGRDPCLCGAPGCRGTINFDVSDADAQHFGRDTPAGEAVRRRIEEYAAFLRSIGQEQVIETVADKLRDLERRLRARAAVASEDTGHRVG
jgi:histone-lysine N-methyltransferase SETD1